MSISDRLQIVIKMNGMTNASFADKIGVQRSSISHVLAGRNKPSIDFIQKILTTFPKVDADWLLTGKKVGRSMEGGNAAGKVEDRQLKKKDTSNNDAQVKDEDQEIYGGSSKKSDETANHEAQYSRLENRKVSKIIVFYTDGSFEEIGSTN